MATGKKWVTNNKIGYIDDHICLPLQLFDIMWSDPQTTMGCKPNTLRGAGVWFGPDITESFLERHRLSYVIRSHECKPNGHEFMHDNKVRK